MKENAYDKQSFFEKYGEMLRSKEGLKGAGEWPTLEKMLPDFTGKRVLDLGCGYGWHCMYAAQQGASAVLGLDLSERMIDEAIQRNTFNHVAYKVLGMEDYDFPSNSYDVVISSLALHYVEDLMPVFTNINRTLTRGGSFIFSIEHPIFTAHGSQEWLYDDERNAIHWPVDRYFIEGKRVANFLGEEIVKYHHTLTSILQGLLKAGFIIKEVIEPQPTKEMLDYIPGMKDELRRPMMLAVSAVKA
ncbi:MAG TPA: class I SAM-dependent methyltransferase [Bacteroides reticulotermitis]|nr:class I SAM-dependent methyltransferase [Bacteroides reticulotermitis]